MALSPLFVSWAHRVLSLGLTCHQMFSGPSNYSQLPQTRRWRATGLERILFLPSHIKIQRKKYVKMNQRSCALVCDVLDLQEAWGQLESSFLTSKKSPICKSIVVVHKQASVVDVPRIERTAFTKRAWLPLSMVSMPSHSENACRRSNVTADPSVCLCRDYTGIWKTWDVTEIIHGLHKA